MSSGRKITLRSSDGESFEVEKAVASEWQPIKYVIEEVYNDGDVIPLPNVNSKILAMVIEYCKKHVDAAASASSSSNASDDDLKSFDSEFVKVDKATLFDLMLAADFLNIKGLLDLTSLTVANMINRKLREDFRKFFNIENDFNPEEFWKIFNIRNDFNPEKKEEVRWAKEQLELLLRFCRNSRQ